jgi:hypothetical protein
LTTVSPLAGRDGPAVISVQRFGFHAQPTTLVLTFDTQLDLGRAEDPANYLIVSLDGHEHRVPITTAVYDTSARTVALHPARRLNLHHRFRLTVIGTGPRGLTDTSGDLLDGRKSGDPGSNFVTIVTASDLVLTTTDTAILRTYSKIVARERAHSRDNVAD